VRSGVPRLARVRRGGQDSAWNVAHPRKRNDEEVTVQIHWRSPGALDDNDRERTEERLWRLAEGRTDLIDVWVDVRENTHHRQGGDEVSIRAQVRGGEVVATRGGDSPKVALQDALASFEREMRRRRGKLATPPPAGSHPPLLGIVDQVLRDRGFGFILTDGGERIYFHRNAVRGGLDFDRLEEGDRVSLEVGAGDEGPQASVVASPPPDAPVP
jgi:cold shock CspA family protein/ribosome-associated translation inhibitor RaiA